MRPGVFVLGSALALGFVLSSFTSPAEAQDFDTSAATIKCDSITKGSVKLDPPLTTASNGSATTKVKGTLTGCTVTGATPAGLQIVSGKISGTLTTSGAASGCAGLVGTISVTGSLTVKWKAASGQKLDFKSTTVSGGTVNAGLYSGPSGVLYGSFQLTGQTLEPESAFAGGTPSADITTQQSAGDLGAVCAAAPPGKGVKTIPLGIGTITL
jgi:hypothetical protein